MKIFQNDYNKSYNDNYDSILQDKILSEYDLLEQSKELKKIKKELEIVNNRLSKMYDELYLPSIIIEKRDNDWYLIHANKKALLLDNINEKSIGKKIIDLYPEIIKTKTLKYFDKTLITGEPQTYQIYYNSNLIKGHRYSSIYKISDNEIVVIYEDITRIKKLEKLVKERPALCLLIMLLLIISIVGWLAYIIK